jgi:hypothetical protein
LAQRDPKAIPVRPGSKVPLASKDLLDRQELKAQQALLVLPDPLVQPELQDLPVPWGPWASPDQ